MKKAKKKFLFFFNNQVLNFFSSIWFLSLLFTLFFVFLLPPLFDKYKITLVESAKIAGDYYYYYDLDNDSFSEQFQVFKTPRGTGIIVWTHDGVIDQWNFRGERFSNINRTVFFGDIDNDNISEVFVVTFYNDSLYLHCFNPLLKKVYFRNVHITDLYKTNGKIDGEIDICTFHDMNGDNKKEIYFSINTGYNAYPRNMYCYDYVNDTLYVSPEGKSSYGYPFAFDLDNDGKPEFFGSSHATGNAKPDAPLSDFFTWFIVLDEKMNFKLPPKKMFPFPSGSREMPLKTKNGKYIVFYNNYTGTKKIKNSLILFDKTARIVKEIKLNKGRIYDGSFLLRNIDDAGKFYLVFGKAGYLHEYDENLKLIEKRKIPKMGEDIRFYDLDKDGKPEMANINVYRDKVIITRADFSEPAEYELREPVNEYYFCLIKNGNKPNRLYLQDDKYFYLMEYAANPFYYFRYGIFLGIFGAVFLIIYGIQSAQKRKSEEKFLAEKKIAELQILSMKNQVDPHFTLNILNSIGALIEKKDKKKADYVFGKYSKLLRNTLLSSDQIATTLQNEIDYVENYLALEKFRLDDKFEFEIVIGKEINTKIKIPKTVIHTFAENAVKHGIRHSNKKGKIVIIIQKNEENYEIIIKDNGIGRNKAKERGTFGTGKGLEILNKILELYFLLHKKKITFEIRDLYDEKNEAAGTEARITVPV